MTDNKTDEILKEVLSPDDYELVKDSTDDKTYETDLARIVNLLCQHVHVLERENRDYNKALRKAHVLLDMVEPDNDVTEEIYNVIVRYSKEF